MLFDINKLLSKISHIDDIDSLSREELESFIDAAPGSPSAAALPHINPEVFDIGIDPEDESVDPLFAYLRICSIQRQLLDYLWATTTQGTASPRDTPHPANVNQLPQVLKAIDHCVYLTTKIRPRVVHSVEKRLLEFKAKTPPVQTDYFGVPVSYTHESIPIVAESLKDCFDAGNERGFHTNAKPPLGCEPEFISREKANQEKDTPEYLLQRFDNIVPAIRRHLAAGVPLPEFDEAANEDWLEEIQDLLNRMETCKKDSKSRAATLLDALHNLFPDQFTEQDLETIGND